MAQKEKIYFYKLAVRIYHVVVNKVIRQQCRVRLTSVF